jgi:hypothetical protein
MEIQTKRFSWPDTGNHVLMVARGVLDARGLEQILDEVAAVAIRHLNCKVLIDLLDADCKIGLGELDRLFHGSRPDLWPRECKTALVCSLKYDQYTRLSLVSLGLVDHGFQVAVFRDARAAVHWLDDGT